MPLIEGEIKAHRFRVARRARDTASQSVQDEWHRCVLRVSAMKEYKPHGCGFWWHMYKTPHRYSDPLKPILLRFRRIIPHFLSYENVGFVPAFLSTYREGRSREWLCEC